MKRPRTKASGLVWLTALALAGAALVASAALAGHASRSASTIKIGFFAPESGFAAADGTSAYDAAKLAVDQINASGGVNGVKLKLVNYDDGSDVKQAVSIATKLVTQDRVAAVVSGSYSDQTLAAAPIYQRYHTPMLAAYAVNPGIPAAGSYIFQQDFAGNVEGAAGAWTLVKRQHAKRIGIVAVDNEFGHSLVDGFKAEAKKLGATIVHADFNQFGEKTFAPVIQSDERKGATGYYMVQYAAEGQQFITAWNQLGLKKPLLGTEGIDSTLQFVKPVGRAANGMVFTTSFNRDGANAVGKKFVRTFNARYHHLPDMVGATTYDSFLVLRRALAKGSSADSIRAGIASTRNFNGATGRIIRYTAKRSVVKPVDLETFRGGQVHHYGYVSQLSIITP